MAAKDITLKLLIDTKANKVLFAEASKDFVDFLFFLLTLPIGTVIKLLTSKSMVGSIGNLYASFSNLNETYLQPDVEKNDLLNPTISKSVTNIPLLINGSSTTSTTSKKYYTCGRNNFRGTYCYGSFTDEYNVATCPNCSNLMTKEINYVPATNSNNLATPSNINNKGSEGYVQGVVSYMISDDLSVTPMSMISSVSMMNKFNVTNLNVLEEKEVKVGTEEGLELLKTSFQSTTVLTDVFLGNKRTRSS